MGKDKETDDWDTSAYDDIFAQENTTPIEEQHQLAAAIVGATTSRLSEQSSKLLKQSERKHKAARNSSGPKSNYKVEALKEFIDHHIGRDEQKEWNNSEFTRQLNILLKQHNHKYQNVTPPTAKKARELCFSN